MSLAISIQLSVLLLSLCFKKAACIDGEGKEEKEEVDYWAEEKWVFSWREKKKNPRSDYHNNDVTNCQPVAPQPMNTWAGWAPHEVKALQAEARQKDRNEM